MTDNIDWETLMRPSPKKKVVKKAKVGGPIENMGARRNELTKKINQSTRPTYEDLMEYQKVSEAIDTKIDQQTKLMMKDFSKK